MNPEHLANLIWNVLSLVTLVLIISRGVVPQLVAEFRSDLFDIRRELFLLMAKGRIPASSPAYVRLRNSLNGLLKRAEEVNGVWAVVAAIIATLRARDQQRILWRTLTELGRVKDESVRADLIILHARTQDAIGRHLRRIRWLSPILLAATFLGGASRTISRLVEADGTRVGTRLAAGLS